MNGYPGNSSGLIAELRRAHWLVKVVLALVLAFIAMPVAASAAFQIAGGAGVAVLAVIGITLLVWFLALPPDQTQEVEREFCTGCGEIWPPFEVKCGSCGHVRADDLDRDDVPFLTSVLNDLRVLHRDGLVDERTFARLRDVYETRLQRRLAGRRLEARAAPHAPPPLAVPPTRFPSTPHPEQPALAAASAEPSQEMPEAAPFTVGDARRAVAGWAAERQADILLYVGAFLLSVAAIIFVAYQGTTLSGGIRFSILCAYAVGFLVLGLLLRKWERVREAGPVFIALGAILLPFVFISLRTQVLSEEQLPLDVLWLLGSTACAALYLVLAASGFGKWYAIPGALASLVSWGSLGSVIGLPPEWFGPWFTAVAGLGWVTAQVRGSESDPARWVGRLSLALGIGAVLFTQSAAGIEDIDRAALPTSYALASLGLVIGLKYRRNVPVVAALPVLLTLTTASTWWATLGLEPSWYAPFIAAAGAGYLINAHFGDESAARRWAVPAALFGIAALASAHAAAAYAGNDVVLPATYGFVFIVTAGAYGRWRWAEAAGVLPPLGVMTTATTWWATNGLGVEWYGAFAALGAAGYLAIAEIDRPDRSAGWRWSAAATGLLAASLAHAGVAADADAEHLALPTTYGLVTASALAAFTRWRWEWRFAPAALALTGPMTIVSTLWVQWDTPVEWLAPVLAFSAAAYIAWSFLDAPAVARSWLQGALASGAAIIAVAQIAQLPEFASEVDRAALPVTYVELTLLAALAIARTRLRYRELAATIPPLTAATGASTAWAVFDMDLGWLNLWLALTALGFGLISTFDHRCRIRWQAAAFAGSLAAIVGAHAEASAPGGVHWQLPATCAAAASTATLDAFRNRGAGELCVPLLVALTGTSSLWAGGVPYGWWAYPFIAVAAILTLTSRWWTQRDFLSQWGWLEVLVLTVVPALSVLVAAHDRPAHGLAVQLMSASILAALAFLARGGLARLVVLRYPRFHREIERVVFLNAAGAFTYGAAASLNQLLEVDGPDRAWAIVAVAVACSVLMAALGRRLVAYLIVAPLALAGFTIAAITSASSEGHLVAILAIATAAPLPAFVSSRRWELLSVANSFLFLEVWALWQWVDADVVLLPVVYSALASLEWLALLGVRRYEKRLTGSGMFVTFASWVPWLVSAAVAGVVLEQEQRQLDPGERLAESRQWAIAAAVLGMASAAVFSEGIRLRLRWVWTLGSAGLLVALLMAIATWQPTNVQAYTAPIGLYILALALTFRSSPMLFAPHLAVHESMTLLGAAFLVFPPAEQSFEPGGGEFGLELIGIGIALLLVGLLLHARWLVPSAILTLTGVSVRMVTGGFVSVPYWLLLGIAGTALVALGLLVLLERERWDQFRSRAVDWWNEASHPGGLLGPPPA